MERIDKSSEIIAKLKAEGKVRVLNSAEDIAAMWRMNKHMEQVRRDFIIKNFNSEQSAARVIFTS